MEYTESATTTGGHGVRGWSRPHVVLPFRRGTRHVNVGRTERMASMVAGGALLAAALGQRKPAAGLAALAGALLLYRGATGHCPVYEAAGIDRRKGHGGRKGTGHIADRHSDTRQALGGDRGIHVDTAITIQRPIAEIYRFWRNLENLPKFMRHLESVSMREAGISHWVARGPAGIPVEWDARIINDIENKLIAWQSLDGSTISTAGSVTFSETKLGTTIHVRFQYEPPAGRLGAAIARLFGEEPNQTVREDLARLKAILENSPALRS